MTLAQAWCAQIAQIEDRAAQCFNLFVQYLGSSSTTPSSKFIPKLGSLNDLDQHGPPEKMALSDDDAQQLGHFLKSEADPVAVPTVEYLLQHESVSPET